MTEMVEEVARNLHPQAGEVLVRALDVRDDFSLYDHTRIYLEQRGLVKVAFVTTMSGVKTYRLTELGRGVAQVLKSSTTQGGQST